MLTVLYWIDINNNISIFKTSYNRYICRQCYIGLILTTIYQYLKLHIRKRFSSCTDLICVLRVELLVNKYPHDSQENV